MAGLPHPAQDQQVEAGQPFKMTDRQARRGARAGEADEVLRGNIRYEQGCADEKPSDIAAGEEIVFGRAFLPGKIHADPEDDGEIDPNDDEINGCERSVGYGDRRCEKHPGLLGVRRRRTKLKLRKFPLTFAASSTSVRPLAVIFFLEPPTI